VTLLSVVGRSNRRTATADHDRVIRHVRVPGMLFLSK
jgi:hypothetical protein